MEVNQDILTEAKGRFEHAQDRFSSEYDRGKDDIDFLLGNQWPDKIKSKRAQEGRPCLAENQLMPFAHQVINDIRQTRPGIKVSPVDDKADIETADVMKGMIKNIEVRSGADSVYDTGAWNGITAGYGWIRVHTEYADETSFDQEITLKRILNPFSVFLDPNSTEIDGSDADYAFIFDDMDKDEFKNRYPEAKSEGFDDKSKGWNTDKKIRIAEYFYKVYTDTTLFQTANGPLTKEECEEQQIDTEGLPSRPVRTTQVKWCKLTGHEVLEETDWVGKYIPIVPVYGEEVYHEDRRKMFSLIHQARDPQSRLNFWLTATTEMIALQPKTPYLGLRGQFKSSASKWATANKDTHAYIEFDPVELPDGTWSVQAPQRQAPPQGSAAMFQEILAAKDGVKSTLGVFNPSLGKESNETSGKAILARQAEGDNATFHFVDNLGKSIRQVGRILVDMIPKIYDGARIARIIGDDDVEENVPINQPFALNGKQKVPLKPGLPQAGFFDLSAGKYDVVVSTGPSYATKRQETANLIMEMGRAVPEFFKVAGDILVKNLDIQDSDIIAERLKSMLPPELRGDDPEQAQLKAATEAVQKLQQQIVQMDAALQDKKSSEANKQAIEVAKLKLEAAKTMAEIQKMNAETRAQIPAEALNEIIAAISNLQAETQDTAQAVDTILSGFGAEQAPSEPGLIQKIGRIFQR